MSHSNLPELSLAERTTFCRTGVLPSRLLASAQKDPMITLLIYETTCPCGANDPLAIRQLRDSLRRQQGRPFFPKTFEKYGAREYEAAVKAFETYRPLKGFHRRWAALRKAASQATLGLAKNGVDLAVDISDEGWQDFALALSEELRSALEDEIKGAVQARVEGAVSERTAHRVEALLIYLAAAETLKMIWDGVKAQQLAKKRHDDPEVFDRKLTFFIGIMATTNKRFNKATYDRLCLQYRVYDNAYWPLLDYVVREKSLRAGPEDTGVSMRATSKSDRAATSSQMPEADNGLKF